MRFIFAIVIGFLVAWAFWLEPSSLTVQNYTLSFAHKKKLSPLRIGIASDIHIGKYFGDEDRLKKIVDLLNEENPDIIVFLGDFAVQKDGVSFANAAHLLKRLHPKLGVYSVLGNHDWWSGRSAVAKALEENNVQLIDNKIIKLSWENEFFQIVGFGDFWEDKNVAGFINKEKNYGDLPTIGFSHNPDIFPLVDRSMSLVVAGHTHGGQVNLPLVGSPIVPSDYGEKYRYGLITENGHQLLVTSGTGNSILPVRFRVHPEVVITEISFHQK